MSTQVKLTRRRVLGILITIGLASAAMGAGTLAVFFDTEETTNNNIEAGTLDLTIDGANEPVQLLDVSDAVPGDRDSNTTTLENTGNVDGTFNVTLANKTNLENSHLDPEQEAGDDTDKTGELASNIYVNVSVAGEGYTNSTLGNFSEGDELLSDVNLDASDTKDLSIEYNIPNSAGNEIQSDSVSADFNVTLSS